MYDNNENDDIEFSYDKPKKGFFKRLFKKDKKKEVKETKREEKKEVSSYKPTYEREIPVVNDDLVRKTDSFNIQNSTGNPTPSNANNELNNYIKNPKTNGNNGDDNFSYYYPEPKIEEVKEEPVIEKKTAYIVMGSIGMIAIVVLLFTLISSASKKYEINVGLDTITLKVGDSFQIPYLTTDQASTKFTIENEEIATVNSNGFLQAKTIKSDKKYLETKITVGTNQINKTIKLYVVQQKTNVAIEDFQVQESITLKKGNRKIIEITNVTPPNNTQTQKYIFESEDSNIANVDSIGIITGYKKGTTNIKVSNASNKDINKVIKITVK